MTNDHQDAEDARGEILGLVGRYYRERHALPLFDPDRDSVRYAGRVFVRHPAFEDIERRLVGDLANTDAVMNRTFFVGVYPGIDDARMGHLMEAFGRFMAGARAAVQAVDDSAPAPAKR